MQSNKAEKIINFLHQYQNDHHIIVHCIFGVSRTGAVVETAKSLFSIIEPNFRKYDPNHLIKRELKQAFNQTGQTGNHN